MDIYYLKYKNQEEVLELFLNLNEISAVESVGSKEDQKKHDLIIYLNNGRLIKVTVNFPEWKEFTDFLYLCYQLKKMKEQNEI